MGILAEGQRLAASQKRPSLLQKSVLTLVDAWEYRLSPRFTWLWCFVRRLMDTKTTANGLRGDFCNRLGPASCKNRCLRHNPSSDLVSWLRRTRLLGPAKSRTPGPPVAVCLDRL